MPGDLREFPNKLQRLAQHALETLDLFKGKQIADTGVLACLLLERLMLTSVNARLLLIEYFKNPAHEYALGLLMRTSLLDMLVTSNLEQELSKSTLDASEFSLDILSDGLNHVVASIDIATEPDRSSALHAIVKSYPDLFEPYAFDSSTPVVRSLKVKQRAKASHLHKQIKGSHDVIAFYELVYHRYAVYSKYEHLNVMYHPMSRSEKEQKENRLIFCFDVLTMQSFILHRILEHCYPELPKLKGREETAYEINPPTP